MTMYKLIYDDLLDSYIVLRKSDGCTFISHSNGNIDWKQFLQDVKEQGYSIVEGPPVGITTDYKDARRAEYPPMEDQLDKIYHSGVNAWKADIKVIKDKYPKSQVGVTTVADLPSWVKDAVDAAD